MNKFDQGLNIPPEANPLNLGFGEDCLGPEVEYRKLNDIRNSLRNFDCKGPDMVYAIAMNVGKKKNIKQKESIYQLYENDPDLFLFVPEPYLKEDLREYFIS